MVDSKPFDEIIDFLIGDVPDRILSFHPSDKTQKRVELLLRKKHSNDLSIKEQSELEYYLMLEHIIRLAKARALKNKSMVA